jgi:hypothetical protein
VAADGLAAANSSHCLSIVFAIFVVEVRHFSGPAVFFGLVRQLGRLGKFG